MALFCNLDILAQLHPHTVMPKKRCVCISELYISFMIACGKHFLSLFITPSVLDILFDNLFICGDQSMFSFMVTPRKLKSLTR